MTTADPDDIDFFYVLERHGWSTCWILAGGKMYEMGPTHIFDNPIELLLSSLTALLAGGTEAAFIWPDEPGEYRWSIKRHPLQSHRITVSISDVVHVSGAGFQAPADLHFEVKLKLFCVCVLRQMQKVRDLLSENSFKEHREGEFPFDTFADFQHAFERAYP